MASIPSYETVLVDRADGITTVTLNRPEKRNAMNPTMHREMYDLLTRLEGDAETRVLVLTGAGKAFCAGQDLKEYFYDFRDAEYEATINKRYANEWRDRLLRMFPRPTMAMINGYCFGGAFTTVCSCDFAFAAEDATFGLSEVNFGNLPGGMVSKVIQGVMAYRDALYYALSGEPFDGKRAAEIKFVNKAFPADQLKEETYKMARKLASMDQAALRVTKEAFKECTTMDYEAAFWWLGAKKNELTWRQMKAGEGGHQEGIERFLAKEYRPGLQSVTEVTKKE